MSAREAIFGKLRAATGTPSPELPDVAGWYAARQNTETRAQRAERLCTALQAARTEVHRVQQSNWIAVLIDLCARKGLRNILTGTGTPYGDALQQRAPETLNVRRYTQPAAEWQDALFDGVDAALTGAKSAIADTGSLVLWPTPEEPRLLSLVPPVHFVLLDSRHIHANWHAAMQAEGWSRNMPTNALLISGPSKTADIQQTLAYGAHGPRELIVLLQDAEGDAA